ncbi:MAG TPA: cytochrome P450 [Solirubrobacterales bacterium]|nr:cytochrome P450 [Solirubrobacterales bacterium]
MSAAPLPPGPDTEVLAQTVAFHRDPLAFLGAAQERYGDVFTIRLLTARPLLVVADPTAVEKLLGADPQSAHAGEARRRILPFASPRSVFGADAEQHGTARGRIAPALSEEAMSHRRPAIAGIAERHAAAWPRGRPFRLLPRTRTLTDEIFVRLVLGVRDTDLAVALIAAIRRMLWTPGNPPLTLPGPGDGVAGRLGVALFERRQAPVARLLARATEARRTEPSEEVDVLGCMVAASPQLSTAAIVDELMSLLMAAQEPPAIALAWLLDRLGREPGLAEGFREDPRSDSSAALVREILRLQPPASAALRRLTKPMQVGKWLLPAGATAMLPTSLLHRDPRGFEDPERFRPQRWLGDRAGGAYFPFGGGARRCVGEPLARAEIEAALPALFEQIRIVPLSRRPERMVQRATVLVPRRGLMVRTQDD